MSLIRKHGAVLQAWACLDLVNTTHTTDITVNNVLPKKNPQFLFCHF